MNRRLPERARSSVAGEVVHLPESPRGPMEFLSRSWSASALLLSKALSTNSGAVPPKSPASNVISPGSSVPFHGDVTAAVVNQHQMKAVSEESAAIASANAFSFSFASSATSQLVLERIMSQSEISPLTSGRLSHSSEPLNGSSHTDGTDSPPVSPSDEYDDVVKYLRSNNSLQPLFTAVTRTGSAAGAVVNGSGVATPGGKTVGRWLKERREKKREENRAHNAQVHAAVSVASVAASVAAIAAATAAATASGKDEQMAKTDMAVASAATLVAAQCVEAAETMGAARELLVAAISSAVNVRSHGDITTLTAAAATALRGVATLKARAVKEVWNSSALIPAATAEKGSGIRISGSFNHDHHTTAAANNSFHGEGPDSEENFLDACNQQLLARGTELLKRTRKGDLHLKIVSVYIHRTGQVMLKMKSKHVAGTITKKKKNVVLEVCKNLPSWPGRHLLEDGEHRRYFGLRTANRGVVEFECKSQREYEIWTHGVSRLLEIIAERNGIRCQP